MSRDLNTYIIDNFQEALDNGYIQAYYQPVIRTLSRQLCSFEALARWIDPEYGVIYPDEFIPVLERRKKIHLLDAQILRLACDRIRSAVIRGEVPIPISVNLSRLDFTLCDIFKVVEDIVSEYQIPHDFIYFEITESVMAERKDLMLGIVSRFREAGYQIWMDDFGSAYSSLNVLKEYDFDEIKLDMEFMRPFNKRSQRIAASVVEMAKGLQIHTLAEGLENEEQVRYMRNIGCEKVQGFFFGGPMPYDDAIEHLKRTGISFEVPQDRKYYDDIGLINILSAVPFMTRQQRDAITTARQLNSIPLMLVELLRDSFRVLFYNSAFETTAGETDLFAFGFSQEMLRTEQPYNNLADRLINLLDSTRSGEEGRMNFTSHEDYYEVQAKCVSQKKDKYCVLVRMSNLTKAAKSLNTEHLDQFLRRIYALYERITLLNLKEDTVTPLYTATREQLVSGNRDISKLVQEYADRFIFPDDRGDFLKLLEPGTISRRFEEAGREYLTELLRSNVRHGNYAWKSYTLLRVDEDSCLLIIRPAHDAIMDYEKRTNIHEEGGIDSPDVLWHNLVNSDLLRIFWKDADRRFLGASHAFLKYYGFDSVESILGKTDDEMGWHIHPDKYRSDEFRVLEEGATTHNIPGFCLSNGENREILTSKTPVYDENGGIAGLLGYFIDRELLTVNDVRGRETQRRDMMTGLLNSRGISEEATAFRDEYYLRGADFVRMHISINDFDTMNEQYGFDFGDRVITELGWALKKEFGLTCSVGRTAGQRFVLLRQVRDRSEASEMRTRVKEIGRSITSVDGRTITLYLSTGFVLFSEYDDLDEQAKKADIRLLADHDTNVSAKARMTNASDIFHLFDNLPLIFAVYHTETDEETGRKDAVIFYINHKYEEYAGDEAETLLGGKVRELYPALQDRWYENLAHAAMSSDTTHGYIDPKGDGEIFKYIAQQIIYPGYCAVVYQRTELTELPEEQES